MDNLPIDIHSNKLLDWLISRRHCKRDWQKFAVIVREKVGLAIKDMPEHPQILELLQGSCIDYFRCKEIVEILKATEESSKNIFGFYSSQRMKDWQNIISTYQRDNLYLAEASHFLQRFIQYEIPSIRKQISRLLNAASESDKKLEEYAKLESESKKNYKKELQKWCVFGSDLRSELLHLSTQLPSFFEPILAKLQSLRGAVDYYLKFLHFCYRQNEDLAQKDTCPLPLCSLLMRSADFFDVTVFEWKYDKKPDKVVRPSFVNDCSKSVQIEDDDIDFGNDSIDFTLVETNDYNIVSLDTSQTDDSTHNESIASGRDALSPLECMYTLNILLAELDEIRSFLTFRRIELTTDNPTDFYLSTVDPSADEATSIESIGRWIRLADDIVAALRDPTKIQLIKMNSSPKFLDDIIEQIESHRKLEDKYKRLQKLTIRNKVSSTKEAHEVQLALDGLIESAKYLQCKIEQDISKKYNNREVYIIGEINSVLY